jgi:hypothetical protein
MTRCTVPKTIITKQIRKIISPKYREAVCIIQDGCTANGIKRKLDDLKDKYLSEKIKVIE